MNVMAPSVESLTDEFRRNGYVVIGDAIERAQIERMRQEIVGFFTLAAFGRCPDVLPDIEGDEFHTLLVRLFEEKFEAYHGAARLCNHALSVHRLSTDPHLIGILERLGVSVPAICARPVVWFHSPRLARTERYHRLPAHQEWSNMQGSIDGAVIWTPIIAVTPEMGRLQVIPGSHLRGLLPFSRDEEKDYALSIDPAEISEDEFIEVDIPIGSALIFSPFLVHRSGINRTDRARITTNFRYNNAADPSFIGRHFINPFRYDAPEELKTPEFPPADLVRRHYR